MEKPFKTTPTFFLRVIPGPCARDPAIHKPGASGRVDPGDERRDDTVVDSATASARVRQTKKAVAQGGVGGKGAKKARGHRGDTGLMNAAHGHALVLGLNHYGNTARRQRLLDRIGDLGAQRFASAAAWRRLLQPGRASKARDLPVWQVRHVCHTDERRDMVLAVALDADVAQHHQSS